MKQFNEKPNKYKNIGSDISGAQRHNFDTYENSEVVAEKAKAKRVKDKSKELKIEAMAKINETNYQSVIKTYEFQRVAFVMGFTELMEYDDKTSIGLLKDFVVSQRNVPGVDYNKLVGKYNRLRNIIWGIGYRVTDRNFDTYFVKKTKNSFVEKNGVKCSWVSVLEFRPESIKYLNANLGAVQFGNSLPEKEREYCMDNLAESVEILQKYLSFDFKAISFSFGARGKAGSIAHYQDSLKVLAFNRGWDGALIHELGHAIDYNLKLVSDDLPRDIILKYRTQLRDNKIEDAQYYMKRVEIFARLFEQYICKMIPEITSFMQVTFDQRVMPELDREAMDYMDSVLKSILKGGE